MIKVQQTSCNENKTIKINSKVSASSGRRSWSGRRGQNPASCTYGKWRMANAERPWPVLPFSSRFSSNLRPCSRCGILGLASRLRADRWLSQFLCRGSAGRKQLRSIWIGFSTEFWVASWLVPGLRLCWETQRICMVLHCCEPETSQIQWFS